MFDVKKLLLNERQTFSLESDASSAPENPQMDSNSVSGSTWKHVQDRVQNPATDSLGWKKGDPCLGSTWKHVQSDVCERSGSSWKQVHGIENHRERTRLDIQIVQISDCRCVEKVLENIRQHFES